MTSGHQGKWVCADGTSPHHLWRVQLLEDVMDDIPVDVARSPSII